MKIINVKEIVQNGVVKFIDYLKANAYVLAVATSASPEEVDIILGPKGLNINQNFNYIINKTQVKQQKPNPEIYIKAIKKLNCLPKKT